MNILHLLKSRAGAISKAGLVGLSVTLGMGGLSIYNYVTSSPAAQEQKIRSLASIMNSGGEMPREYQSMNFSMGNNQFASAEERAKIEGQMADKVFNGGEDAVNAIEGLNFGPNNTIDGVGGIQGAALGAGEAGLGMGANEVAELAGNGRARGAAQKGSTEGVDAAAAAQGQKEGNKLQRAAINYKGGSNLGSGTSFGGGNSGGSATGAGRLASSAHSEGQSRIGANSITGAMGGDGPLVKASPQFQGAHSSSFVSGSRYGRTGTGINSEAGNNLRLIAKQSSKVAANRNRAANEGSSPFMADTKLAAGITVDGVETGTSFGAMGDDSFDKGLDTKIGDLGDSMEDISTKEAERAAGRKKLAVEFVAILLAAVTGYFTISQLMRSPEPWGKGVAIALGVVLLAWFAFFMVRCAIFAEKFDHDWTGWLLFGLTAIPAVVVGLGFSQTINDYRVKKATEKAAKKGLGVVSLAGDKLFAGGAVTAGLDGVKNIATGAQDLANDGNGDSTDK